MSHILLAAAFAFIGILVLVRRGPGTQAYVPLLFSIFWAWSSWREYKIARSYESPSPFESVP